MYLDKAQRAGSVRMRVFKQLCYECGTARLDESSMLEENIESLVDNLITSLREQCYGERGGHYRIHVASRQDNRRHRGEFCEACQEGIVHWKPSEKLLEEEATTYTFSRAPSPTKPQAETGSGCNFCSIPWWESCYSMHHPSDTQFGMCPSPRYPEEKPERRGKEEEVVTTRRNLRRPIGV